MDLSSRLADISGNVVEPSIVPTTTLVDPRTWMQDVLGIDDGPFSQYNIFGAKSNKERHKIV